MDKTKYQGAMLASPTGKQDKVLQESFLASFKDYIMYWAGGWYEHLGGEATGAAEDFITNPLIVITTSYRVSHWANAAICRKAESDSKLPVATLTRPDPTKKVWTWGTSREITALAGNSDEEPNSGPSRQCGFCVAISGYRIEVPRATVKASRASLAQYSTSRVSLSSMKSGWSRLTGFTRSRRQVHE